MELRINGVMVPNLVIPKMDEKTIEELISLFPLDEIEFIIKPRAGLLMMTTKDSFDTDFYLGEILITEASVKYKGLKGYAMLMGNQPEKTLLAALLDAILQADISNEMENLKKKIIDLITMHAQKIEVVDKMERFLIEKTKVNFDTMVKR